MATYTELQNLLDAIRKNATAFAQDVKTAFDRRTEELIPQAKFEFGEYQREAIKGAFDRAIRKFYQDYTPTSYKRHLEGQRGSLFELLSITKSPDGTICYESPMDLIDKNKMLLDRQGNNSLFETVFMEGWHGGAKGISPEKEAMWGVHPNPGTAYYRASGIAHSPDGTPFSHPFGVWGRKAERSTPPYEDFASELEKVEATFHTKLYDITQSKVNDMNERIRNEDVPALVRKYFS